MAILSLVAAVVAFRGPRLKVSQLETLRRPGLAGAFGYGFGFSLGTSVAPLLLLLTVSAANGRPEYGFLLAFTFGLGRGLPFLLAGLVASTATRFTRLGHWRSAIQVASGFTLLSLQPPRARVLRGGQAVDVLTSEVTAGEVVVVKPGERIPLDGEVVDGSASVDESSFTGESVPSAKTVASEVIGGTLNLDGALQVRVTKVGAESFLSQIVRLMIFYPFHAFLLAIYEHSRSH